MTARVQIQIEAQDSASGVLRAIASQFGALGNVASDLADVFSTTNNLTQLYNKGLTDLSVSVEDVAKAEAAAQAATARLAETIAVTLINGLKDAYNAYDEYAKQVRDVALASGQGAEASSRLLQVLDDFEISAQDVTAATRAMTKQGLEPSIETLAQLSDEYLSITSAQERNDFVIKNLGRSGLQWTNVLKEGGAALRAMSDEVSDNLILSDEQIANYEKQRLALDALADSWQGIKVQVGSFLGESILLNQQMVEYQELTNTAAQRGGALTDEFVAYQAQMERGSAMTEFYNEQLQNNSNLIEDEYIPNYKDLISSIMDYQQAIDRYEETSVALQETESSLKGERDELIAQLQDLKNRGYGETSAAVQNVQEKIEAVTGKMEENKKKVAENEEAYRKWAAQTVFSFAQARAASDGTITDMEGKLLINMGQALGLFDEKTAETMEKVNEAFSTLDTEDAEASIAALQDSLEALTGQTWTINIDTNTTGGVSSTSVGGSSNYASGGEVYAGRPVLIGENGAESFIPSSNGRIIGHAEALHAMSLAGGSNYFYGNVTLQVDGDAAGGLLEYR